MKVRLKDAIKSPTVDIGIGMYNRQFSKADPPIEVDKEEGEALLRTGMFDEVEESAPASPAETSSEAPPAPDASASGIEPGDKTGKRGRK